MSWFFDDEDDREKSRGEGDEDEVVFEHESVDIVRKAERADIDELVEAGVKMSKGHVSAEVKRWSITKKEKWLVSESLRCISEDGGVDDLDLVVGQVNVGERVKAGQVMSLNPDQLVAAKVDLLELHHGLGGVEWVDLVVVQVERLEVSQGREE